ncbi:MAG TPA: ferritin-like domain-containing protein [Azospirillaceae bacterium]|nr:ferritin-like domain-containing protein [Azospirillaceae bacterium]
MAANKQKTMQDLLIQEMRDIYNAEQQAVRAYPKLIKAATAPELKQALEKHFEQTRGQVERLQQAFEKLDINARGKACHAMEGLIDETRELIEEDLAPELLDAALIATAQKMEHYEIASYGTVVAYADALGQKEVADLLRQTLGEEKQTDQTLNQLAVDNINKRAMQATKAA